MIFFLCADLTCKMSENWNKQRESGKKQMQEEKNDIKIIEYFMLFWLFAVWFLCAHCNSSGSKNKDGKKASTRATKTLTSRTQVKRNAVSFVSLIKQNYLRMRSSSQAVHCLLNHFIHGISVSRMNCWRSDGTGNGNGIITTTTTTPTNIQHQQIYGWWVFAPFVYFCLSLFQYMYMYVVKAWGVVNHLCDWK